MRKLATLGLILAAIGSLSVLTACPPPPPAGVVYVRTRPPVPVVEVISTAPGPEFVWVRGYHRWEGNTYVWFPGRWERRPRAGAVWVEGAWRHHRNGWYWVEGHWR
jgi:hypothetical protein